LADSRGDAEAVSARARTLLTPPSKDQIAQLGVPQGDLGLNVEEILQRRSRKMRKAR